MSKEQDLQKSWDKHVEKEFIKWAIKNNHIKPGSLLPANFLLNGNTKIDGLFQYKEIKKPIRPHIPSTGIIRKDGI